MPTGSCAPVSTGTGEPCSLPRLTNGGGPVSWELSGEQDGHRTYKVVYQVEVNPAVHGPNAARLCPGLPETGSLWSEFGTQDSAAFFTNEFECKQVSRTQDNKFYHVTKTATTRPTNTCQTSTTDDPLTLPDRIKIRTVNYQKEGTEDRNQREIVNSAFEQIRGPQNEWDAHRFQILIEQNVPLLELDVVDGLMHHLNDAPMWGFPERTIKLSAVELDRAYKANCDKYVIRRMTFDVANDFDRCVLDEGTKVLRGKWDKDPNSATYGRWIVADDPSAWGVGGKVNPAYPKNFMRYQDWNGNNTRVILDGSGKPFDPDITTGTGGDTTPGRVCIEYYPNGNFAVLNMPPNLEFAP